LSTGGLGISPDIPHTPEGDAALETYARSTARTIYHPIGTAAMAKRGVQAGTKEGVVDSHLRVLGVDGLRVVDASVFVSTFSQHRLEVNTYNEVRSHSFQLLTLKRLYTS
jgi:hypothetical protein